MCLVNNERHDTSFHGKKGSGQRLAGVEPVYQPWEGRVLPIYYNRIDIGIVSEKIELGN